MQIERAHAGKDELRLREELEDTFPASDPPAVTRRRSGEESAGESGTGVLSGQDARQGQIILRSPLARAIFIAGLAGCVLVGLWLSLRR